MKTLVWVTKPAADKLQDPTHSTLSCTHTYKCKEIIYTKVVCEIHEGKDDKNCTRITVAGNLLFYPGNAGTHTASLDLIKLMLNNVILLKGAQFSTINVKFFTLTCQW